MSLMIVGVGLYPRLRTWVQRETRKEKVGGRKGKGSVDKRAALVTLWERKAGYALQSNVIGRGRKIFNGGSGQGEV